MVNSWLNNIQYALLPGRCILCGNNSARAMDLCPGCERDLFRHWAHCRSCGLPTPVDTLACGSCSRHPFHFDCCIALAPYQPPIDRLITDFKYHRRLSAGRVLAQLLAQRLRSQYAGEDWPQQLIPVPLHWRRQWRRGFNQSRFLAQVLGRELQIPLQTDCLHRCRATQSQQGMDRQQRRANLQSAFTVNQSIAADHVALVDDVLTTGSTADRICRLLADHGAKRVDIWCLARTPSP